MASPINSMPLAWSALTTRANGAYQAGAIRRCGSARDHRRRAMISRGQVPQNSLLFPVISLFCEVALCTYRRGRQPRSSLKLLGPNKSGNTRLVYLTKSLASRRYALSSKKQSEVARCGGGNMENDSDDDDKCGYSRPPKRHRFKPGRSGTRVADRGRKTPSKSMTARSNSIHTCCMRAIAR